jgi:hypothetical protein
MPDILVYDAVHWEQSGTELRPLATPLPVASAAYVRWGVPHLAGSGLDVLPDTNNVRDGIWYGTNALEFEGTYGTSSLISSTNIRNRIRDRSARALLRVAKRLGFQFAFQPYESASHITGLWAVDVSSDEVRTVFGGNVDALNRVIDIPRQTLITGEPFPPAAGFKVNCRIIINSLHYGVDPSYATVDVQDAAMIRVVLRRWEYITVELDG